jgi:hypothetical protein
MELTWINKLRIAVVAALGILVIGMLAWPLAAPADPLAPVRATDMTFLGKMALLALALGLGFVGYFLTWPHGREMGILTVPFGLAVWAARSGPMRVLTQAYAQPDRRQALVSSLRFESVYWLLVAAAGFAGVLLAQHLRRAHPLPEGPTDAAPPAPDQPGQHPNANAYVTGALALAAAIVLAHFFVGAFAQDVATSRNITPTQPPIGQIVFAVLAAFAVAGFVVKKFAHLSYLWPALASLFLPAFAQVLYGQGATLRQFAETRPATFFAHSALAILPVQFVALGTLGSILGYWMAIRYDWWRTHESAA